MRSPFFIATSVAIFCGLIFSWIFHLYLVGLIFMLAVWLGLVAYGAANIRSGFFVKAICRNHTKGIVLTFDDGPVEATNEILGVLKKHGVKAMFFFYRKEYSGSRITRENSSFRRAPNRDAFVDSCEMV